MLLYILATFCVVYTSGYSVLDGDYDELQSDTEGLYWPKTYSVKATQYSLFSDVVEDYTAWKTKRASRIDYNQGAVIKISIRPAHRKRRGDIFMIRPETTEEELNKIVCHSRHPKRNRMELESILPAISEDDGWMEVGNETMEGVETVKFECSTYKEWNNEERKRTVWAYYVKGVGWIPVRYERKIYNSLLAALKDHDVVTYFDFALDVDKSVFDGEPYNCTHAAVEHEEDSDTITKELMFIDPENEDHVDYIFNHFRNKYVREYADEHEHASRREIFRENMRIISSVNSRNLGYKLGINQFSDMTLQERERSFGAIPRPHGLAGTIPFPYEESEIDDIVSKLPKQYDMRMLGLISPVKDQRTCGSCWTFAAAAVIESSYAKVNGGRVLALSTQALVDCAYEGLAQLGGGGCRGGYDLAAYEFALKHGLPTEEEYGPYKNIEGFCHIGNMTKTYRITGYTNVTSWSNNAIKVALVNHGPLFVSVDASDKLMLYNSGIFYDAECDPDYRNHAVTLVGYGERDGELYWIIKNSWGATWGSDGYINIAAKNNVCGVATAPSYVVF